ncbi:MAG TPA: AraC family transcriptional regulator [Clostridiaceae bacterium]|nr:AraC family transcriptional regulator [Clostridiaceae bacterium]
MMNNRELFNKERIEIYFPTLYDYSFKLGRVNYSKAHPPLELHVHEGMMEIVLIVKGKQIYTVAGNDYLVRSGDVFVTFPDEPHSTAGYPEDKSLLYFLIIDLEKLKTGFLGCDDKEGRLIVQSLNRIKRRVFKGSEGLKPMLDKVITAFYSDCPFKNTLIRNQISDFIINIIECERADNTLDNSYMQKVLDYIEQNICEDINVPMLAEIAGLSEARFKINFRKQIGIPPREYVLRRKIEAAKNVLKNSDITVTELAHRLSFSSSQYFSTVFKRFTLMSPREFRKIHR